MDDAPEVEALLAHGRFLRALARDILRDAHQAEDVVQEAWLRARNRAPRKAGAMRAWLARIVRNLALDRVRAEQARRQREVAVGRAAVRQGRTAMSVPPPDVAARFEVQKRTADAVLDLPEPYRSTILMRYFEDLAPREIARRVGVPGATVRTRVRRGLAMLRKALDERYGRRAWPALLVVGGGVMAKLKGAAVVAAVLAVIALTVWRVRADPERTRGRSSEGRRAASTSSGLTLADSAGDTVSHRSRRILSGVVLETSGRPASGAVVRWRLRQPDLGWQPFRHSALHSGSATCDDAGRFRLSVDRRAGSLSAVKDGDVSPDWEVGTGDPGAGLVLHLRTPVSVVIRVIENRDRPVTGAQVRVAPTLLGPFAGDVHDGATDSSGRVRIAGVQPGFASVVVRAAGYVTAVRRAVRLPGNDVVVRLRRGRPFFGIVCDAGAVPVQDARVRWVSAHEHALGGEQRTDAGGRFLVPALPAGRIAFFVEAGATGQAYHVCARPAGRSVGERQRFALDPPVGLEGRVWMGEKSARRPLVGIPVRVSGAEFFHVTNRGTFGVRVIRFGSLSRRAVTDADGRFAFAGLSHRATQLSLAPPFYVVKRLAGGDVQAARAGRVHGTVRDEAGRPVAGAVVLRPGGEGYRNITNAKGQYELSLVPGAKRAVRLDVFKDGFTRVQRGVSSAGAIDFRLARVSSIDGRVVSAAGRPILGVKVGPVRNTVFTDRDGRFRFFRSPETTSVPFVHESYEYRSVELSDEATVVLSPAPVRVFVRGRVLDTKGEPIGEADVTWRSEGRHEAAITDGRGRFELGLAAGAWTVVVERDGYAPWRREDVDVPRAELLEIIVRSGSSIAGRVVDAGGAAVAGATVIVSGPRDAGKARNWRATTGVDGGFHVDDLPHGQFAVIAAGPSSAAGHDRAHDVAADTVDLELRFAASRALSGRVFDPDGRPWPGVGIVVRVTDADLRRHRLRRDRVSAVTDGDGRFHVKGLHGTHATIAVDTNRGSRAETYMQQDLRVEPGQRDIEIRVRTERTITGRVLDPKGAPVAGVWVSITDVATSSGARLTTDGDGRFRFHGRSRATYEFSASARRIPFGPGMWGFAWAGKTTAGAGTNSVTVALQVDQNAVRMAERARRGR